VILHIDEGKIYTYGFGEYGALGLYGVMSVSIPSLVKSISNKKVIQIACGAFHTMALTCNNYLYLMHKCAQAEYSVYS